MVKPAKLLIYSFIILLLVSCSKSKDLAMTPSPSPKFIQVTQTITMAPLATTATPISITPTLKSGGTKSTPTIIVNSNLDLSSIYSIPNQVSDGKLMLSIERTDNTCYHPGEAINIKASYLNLTDESIVLVDYNFIAREPARNAYAHLYPILATTDNEHIRSREVFMNLDAFNVPSPIFLKIPPRASSDFLGEYFLPREIGEEDENQNVVFKLLPPGQYLLKLVYIAHEYRGSWEGQISSNQIERCVVE